MPEKELSSGHGGPGKGAKMQPGGLQEEGCYLVTTVVSGYRAKKTHTQYYVYYLCVPWSDAEASTMTV